MKPKITIGMAHIRDFNGAYFTIQHLRLTNPGLMDQVQFVVVDNDPSWEVSKSLRVFCQNVSEGMKHPCIYDAYDARNGTSAARDRIFDLADGEYVLVMDCHVLLFPNALPALLRYYDHNPDTKNIVTGPIMMDNFVSFQTHFNFQWRSHMWGTWGVGYGCTDCGSRDSGFTMIETPGESGSLAVPHCLTVDESEIKQSEKHRCGKCGKAIPTLPWNGHENALTEKNEFYVLAGNDQHSAFEIPGNGLGLFSCRKDAWQGFNKDHQGFGGEELYIHAKFRRNGGKAMCLPALRWGHRFERGTTDARYPSLTRDRIRNYVLEFNEMGWDISPIYAAIVQGNEQLTDYGLHGKDLWDMIVSDPIGMYSTIENRASEEKRKKAAEKYLATDLDDIFDKCRNTQRDLNEHMTTFVEYAAKCESVFETTERRESTIAFLLTLSKPFSKTIKLTSLQGEDDELISVCTQKAMESDKHEKSLSIDIRRPDSDYKIPDDETYELMFFDTEHTADHVLYELETYGTKCTRFIILHDTQSFGAKGSDGGKGIWHAMRLFFKNHPEWSVIKDFDHQYGLTILGCQPEDKPKIEAKLSTQAKSFMSALTGYVRDGMQNVTEEEYRDRLETCEICESRSDNRCAKCGCNLAGKAKMRTQVCPLSKWKEIPEVKDD